MARKSKPALTPVPQTREEFETLAVQLGEGMRELAAAAESTATAITKLKLALKLETTALEKRLATQFDAVAAYATAHRAELLPPDRKSVTIAAGVIGWRMSSPAVTLVDEAEVIEALEAAGLVQFLREKVEVDKTALLAEPALAATIDGVTIRQAEHLFFKPLDIEAERTKTLKSAPAASAEAA